MRKSILLTFCLVMVFSLFLTAQAADRNLAGKFTVGEMLEYKSFSNYLEAPEMQKLVEQGKIPPVAERLPQEPLVWKNNVMVDGPGEYGDVWRDTVGVPADGWNWGAGQTQGYYGINQMVQESLITTGPMWMLKNPEPIPQLARSWEWSEDGKSLTMHLMKGVKWSDGVEFTSEDVLFTYYDNILDDNVPSLQGSGPWTFNDKIADLVAIDKYTIKWTFGVAFPVRIFFYMDLGDFSISPAHIYKHYHPKYNTNMTYDDYIKATPPEDTPAVVLGPYVPVAYEPDQQMILQKNPFYWQVDEDGKQLPYFDEVIFTSARTMETRTLNTLAGSADRTNIHSPKLFTLALKTSKEPKAHFKLFWTEHYNVFELQLNFSKFASVNDDRDKALRELFRDIKFRQALSHAIDRQGIADAVFPGDATIPFYGGYPKASPYYDKNRVYKYVYDLEKASTLLSELGFTKGADGILDWPEGSPMAGQNLVIEALASSDLTTAQELGEMLVPLFREVGINLRLKVLKPNILQAKVNAGDFEMLVQRQTDKVTAWANSDIFGPLGPYTPPWHIADPEKGRELLPFEKEIKKLLASTATMTDATERGQVFADILDIYTKNLYTIGVYQKADLLAIAKRFRNIPDDVVMHMWQWQIRSLPFQYYWTPKEIQLKPQYMDMIPVPETYQNQNWYPAK